MFGTVPFKKLLLKSLFLKRIKEMSFEFKRKFVYEKDREERKVNNKTYR